MVQQIHSNGETQREYITYIEQINKIEPKIFFPEGTILYI